MCPQPSYPLFSFLGDVNDVRMVPYRLTYAASWRIDFDSLENSITDSTRAVLLVNPNNPTGSFIKRDEIERLNGICQKHNLVIMSDEVFNNYAIDDEEKLSLINNTEVLTFVLSGLSKVLALPQMKLAWIIMNGPHDQMKDAYSRLEMIADTYLSVSTPVQNALVHWLSLRKEIQNDIRNRIEDNLAIIEKLLDNHISTLLKFEGGWSAVLRFNGLTDDFAYRLLDQHKVYIHPGYFYDFDEASYCVLSLLTPTNILAEGLERILKCQNGG